MKDTRPMRFIAMLALLPSIALAQVGPQPYVPPTTPLNQRAPTSADTTALGYVTGSSLWNYGGMWQLNQASPAVWQPLIQAATLPCDQFTALAACYGTRRLRAAYGNGPAFDVQFTSAGTATTINFTTSGLPDYGALDAATAAAGAPPRVVKLYDQSAVGAHATAAWATAPTIQPGSLCGGARSLIFDSVINGGSPVQRYMTLPAGATVNQNLMTVAWYGRAASSLRPVAFWQLSGSANWTMSYNAPNLYPGNSTRLVASGLSAFGTAMPPPTMAPEAIIASTGAIAGGTSYREGDVRTAGAGSTPGSGVLAGGYIGAVTASAAIQATGYQETCGYVVAGQSISAATDNLVRASFHLTFGTYPQATDAKFNLGDSIDEGWLATYLQNASRQEEALLGKPARIYNVGYYGATLAQITANWNTYAKPLFATLTGRNRVVEIEGGTNSIGAAGQTAVATETDLQNQATAVCSANPTLLIVDTLTPNAGWSTSQQTQAAAYNAWVRANVATLCPTISTVVNDLAADPTLAAGMSNTAISPDGLHFTTLGYSFRAGDSATTVNPVLQ